jgi:hypothetical protein
MAVVLVAIASYALLLASRSQHDQFTFEKYEGDLDGPTTELPARHSCMNFQLARRWIDTNNISFRLVGGVFDCARGPTN